MNLFPSCSPSRNGSRTLQNAKGQLSAALAVIGSLLAGCLTPVHAQAAPKIIWVSFHADADSPSAAAAAAGFSRAPDAGYTDLLEGAGADVIRYLTTGTPDAATLQEADLVIISRSVPSGNYQDAAATAWNSISAPTMVLGGYAIRGSRLGFTTGETIPDTAGTISLTVDNPSHPIFDGIQLGADNTMVAPYGHLVTFNGLIQRGISVNTDPVAGNGVVLATVGTAGDPAVGGMIIAEWQAGATMGNATADTLAGRRLVFLTGSRELNITSEGAGIYDLEPAGEQLFLNAVNYMTGANLVPPPKISDILPADGAIFADAASGLRFTVSSSEDIPTDGITLSLNGTDVSASLQFSGPPTARQVTSTALEAGKLYTAIISVANAVGSRTATVGFDTFSESSSLVIEAEDFNFSNGQFFDTVVLCNDFGAVINGCYFDRVSTPGVDARDTLGFSDDSEDASAIYRWGPSGLREEEVDTALSTDVLRDKYVGIPDGPNGPIRDYDVESLNAGDWQNYTRTLAQGVYHAYLRASSTVDQEIELGLVSGSAAQPNQTIDIIGTFKLTAGGYQTVTLTGSGGDAAKAFQAGGQTTLRLTTLSGGGNLRLNFFFLVPSDQQFIPSDVSLNSPQDGARFFETKPITLSATASGPDGSSSTIAQVEFFAHDGGGNVSLGVVTSVPFSVTTSSLAPGTYSLTARATDSTGGTVSSSPVSITVRPVIQEDRGTIVWVSFHPGDDEPSANAAGAGFTQAPDVGYTDLLWANGYNVTRYVTTATPDPAAFAAADLVIVSRSVNSANYQDAGATAWNGLSKPMMVMGGYAIRNIRMGYTTGGTIPDTTTTIRLRATEPTHPIFTGISLDETGVMRNPFAHIVSFNGTTQRGISVNTDPLAGNGTLLASIGTADPANSGTAMIIGEWQAGATMGNAASDVLAGHRLVFLSGSREQGIPSDGAGMYDLELDGERLLLNAVMYMITGDVPSIPEFAAPTINPDGTITITWTGGGTLQSSPSLSNPNWQLVNGATSDSYTANPAAGNAFFRVME